MTEGQSIEKLRKEREGERGRERKGKKYRREERERQINRELSIRTQS